MTDGGKFLEGLAAMEVSSLLLVPSHCAAKYSAVAISEVIRCVFRHAAYFCVLKVS